MAGKTIITGKAEKCRQVLEVIEQKLNTGIGKQEIFEELSQNYSYEYTVAQLVAMTPPHSLKQRYKRLNQILIALLLFAALVKVLVALPILSRLPAVAFPLLILVPALNVWFAMEIAKFKGYIYRPAGLLALAALFKAILPEDGIASYGLAGWVIYGLNCLLILAIAVLAFYLAKRLFPNYGLLGPKRDPKGNYLF